VNEAAATRTQWAEWRPHASGADFTVGVEEEVMLLHPHDWSLAQQIDRVLPGLPRDLAAHVTPETHKSALELATGVHGRVEQAAIELAGLRAALQEHLSVLGLRAAAAGTHPFTVWHETVVSSDGRYQLVYGSMRELARREPTFALHVHVGVRDPEAAVALAGRMRAHLPILLALSANSPFWQGRDTGLASARTPLFQAFPRVGIPRAFDSYSHYVDVVDLLIRSGAFPEPTFLWWDVRLQPRFGTVEVRIMDAQTSVEDAAALVALVQSLARLEWDEGFACEQLLASPEILDENRFVAARDGVEAELIEPSAAGRVSLRAKVEEVIEACRPHAVRLGCEAELDHVATLTERPPAARQVLQARGPARLPGLVHTLSDSFSPAPA
jgi:glutamate---cysteine ligase / carboxylate-amine ligase